MFLLIFSSLFVNLIFEKNSIALSTDKLDNSQIFNHLK